MTISASRMPEELRLFQYLETRFHLSEGDRQYLLNMIKGYEGEQLFAELLRDQEDTWTIFHDVILEWNNTMFQIDTFIIFRNKIYLFEIKNYEGDFYIENDVWYSSSNKEIKNPLLQLSRCESLLRQLLQHHGFRIPIESYIIFINPEFTLFQATMKLPIILPTQLKRFLSQLKTAHQSTSSNQRLAELITTLRKDKSPYTKIPSYTFDELKKGIICNVCSSFEIISKNRQLICRNCGSREGVDSGVLRTTLQFKTLFPNEKITSKVIYDWCQIIDSRKTISRVLAKYFTRLGHAKSIYYVDPSEID
jgi:Nuclease-related domain